MNSFLFFRVEGVGAVLTCNWVVLYSPPCGQIALYRGMDSLGYGLIQGARKDDGEGVRCDECGGLTSQ